MAVSFGVSGDSGQLGWPVFCSCQLHLRRCKTCSVRPRGYLTVGMVSLSALPSSSIAASLSSIINNTKNNNENSIYHHQASI